MKKNLIALLAVSVMTMTSVMAAESTNAVSKWLDNASSSVSKAEQTVTSKTEAKKQELAANKKANEEAKTSAKTKVQTKKNQLKQLLSE
jgi:hypothetical protein